MPVCLPAPIPSSTPEGAGAETPWVATAHSYQIDDNSSSASWEGQELAAGGGHQMCECAVPQALPSGSAAGEHRSGMTSQRNRALFLRCELSECKTCFLLVPWRSCGSVSICLVCSLLLSVSAVAYNKDEKREKNLTFVLAQGDLWLLIWLS